MWCYNYILEKPSSTAVLQCNHFMLEHFLHRMRMESIHRTIVKAHWGLQQRPTDTGAWLGCKFLTWRLTWNPQTARSPARCEVPLTYRNSTSSFAINNLFTKTSTSEKSAMHGGGMDCRFRNMRISSRVPEQWRSIDRKICSRYSVCHGLHVTGSRSLHSFAMPLQRSTSPCLPVLPAQPPRSWKKHQATQRWLGVSKHPGEGEPARYQANGIDIRLPSRR